MIIQCAICDKKNRVAEPFDREGEYRCGSCGHVLDLHKATRPPAKTLVPLLQQALRDEIEAIKKQGAARYSARNGYRLRRHAQFSVYEFEVDELVVAPDDSPVTVQVGNRMVKGSLVSSTGFRVTVELEEDIGANVAQAVISASPQYLLERLSEVLEAMAQGSITVFWSTLEKLFGPEQVRVGREGTVVLTSNKTSQDANPSQHDAIALALGSDIAVIWGPPGTGKTTTLGMLVDALLHAGLRVLVVAHTNVAVDQAVLKIIDACEDTQRIQEGKVVRFGSPAIRDPAEFERISKTTVDGIVASLASRDREQLQSLEHEAARLRQTIETLESLKPTAEDERRTRAAVESEQRGLNGARSERDDLKERVTMLSQEVRQAKGRLEEIKHTGLLKRLLLSGERTRLEEKLRRLLPELERRHVELRSATERLLRLENSVKEARAEHDEAVRKLTEHGGLMAVRIQKWEDLQKVEDSAHFELKAILSQIDETEKKIAARSLDVLREASVIATTLAKCYMSSEMMQQKFDVTIVDEASMAPLPMVYFAVSLSGRKTIIVGDFRQLPPIAQAETEAATTWLKRDLFAFMGIDGEHEKENLALLDVQYRMHPSIASVANLLVYDGQLKNATTPVERSYHEPLGVLALLDSGSLMPTCHRTEDFTRFNLLHALLCGIVRGSLNSKGLHNDGLGVIAPYRAQAKLLRKLFADIGDETTVCSTVHKFQGREKAAIIFDATDFYPQKIGRLLSGSRDSDGGKILNVAITRPKDVLVVIAGAEYVQTNGGAASQLQRLLGEIRRTGNVIDAEALLPGRLQDVVNGKDERARAQVGAVEAELFIQDAEVDVAAELLKAARTRRVVVKPRIVDLPPLLFDSLINSDSGPRSRSIVITRNSPNSGVEVRLERLGVRVVRGNPEMELTVGDSNMVMIPDVGRCLDGTPFGLALYGAENTTEELLKLARVHRLLRELEDDYNPIHLLDGKRLERSCPACGGELKTVVGQYGPFIGCSNRGCQYKERLSDEAIEELLPEKAKTCPNGHQMIVRRSWKGERRGVPFLGCSRYPDCRSTKSLSKSRRS